MTVVVEPRPSHTTKAKVPLSENPNSVGVGGGSAKVAIFLRHCLKSLMLCGSLGCCAVWLRRRGWRMPGRRPWTTVVRRGGGLTNSCNHGPIRQGCACASHGWRYHATRVAASCCEFFSSFFFFFLFVSGLLYKLLYEIPSTNSSKAFFLRGLIHRKLAFAGSFGKWW
jgi:hypothetical protein